MPMPRLSLKARALRYLSAREHSRMELARKLARHAGEGEDIEALLDQLEAAKLLSEARFSESLVHRRASRYGNNRILSELQSHGLESEALGEVKAGLVEGEASRAAEVLRKKFAQLPVDAADKAKRIRFLMQRGFTQSAIREAMRLMEMD
ncbi:MAG: recX [Paucimonas sp.]|jgi:regulatory protein|nr:recX [Paucimonas sp.]